MSVEIRKRKADEQNEQSNGKKARIGSPVPIILDEFETEAKREVEANPGLTGAEITAGQTISLSHQVSLSSGCIHSLIPFNRLDIKSRYPLRTIMHPSRRMFLTKTPHVPTLLNWILFKKSLYTPSNGTSLF